MKKKIQARIRRNPFWWYIRVLFDPLLLKKLFASNIQTNISLNLLEHSQTNVEMVDLGKVVQSTVSLTSSLRFQQAKCFKTL